MASPRWDAALERAAWPVPSEASTDERASLLCASSPCASGVLSVGPIWSAALSPAPQLRRHVPQGESFEQLSWWQRHRRLLLIVPCAMGYTVMLSLLAPRVVKLLKRHFGSDGDAAMAQAMYDSGGSLLAFLFAGFFGALSDSFGRRPLIIIAALMNVLPPLVLWLNADPRVYLGVLQCGTIAAGGKGSALAIIPYLADSYPPESRTQVFGFMLAAMCIGLTVGPVSASLPWDDDTAFFAGFCACAGIFVYALLVVPESLPKDARIPFSSRRLQNPFAPLRHLCASRMIAALAALSFLTTLPEMGMIDIFLFYLDDQLNFSKTEQSWFLFELGWTMVIGQGPLIYLLLRALRSEEKTLWVALAANFAYLGAFMAVREAWQIFAFVGPLIAPALLCFPILNGLASKHFGAHEQGLGIGIIQAVKGLAMCIGPVAFSQLYGQCKGPPVSIPQMPFVGGLVLMGLAVLACIFMLRPALAARSEVDDNPSLDAEKPKAACPSPPPCICIPQPGEALPDAAGSVRA
eukprot:TRINITY_DN20338_c0_g1_i2.p1 TRINITY_DN20338_c0_g1~~TRINITY_DN20338_c0_g1_i2.p1  ORF type:complete len:521 (+),score=156.62 TRINITY_DN20338_c0_g1_i2:74-1636(+)